jgi:lipoyl(octanoyl) transferase
MQKYGIELPRASWRLIITPPERGSWNMAVDEAILDAAGREQVPPTLRLYAWSPPCLSIGFSQPAADVDLKALNSLGWDIVRRPTGGRSILHTDELTYSVCGPDSEPRLAGSVLESYRRLSAALLDALHRLKIPAETQPELDKLEREQYVSKIAGADGAVCFELPSSYEITALGKKLVGSAQSRKREGVLQHGSLPLRGDLTRILQVLVFPEAARNGPGSEPPRERAARRLLDRATTAEGCLGQPVAWETAAHAFQAAFSHVLNLELQPADLTAGEIQRAQELVKIKYEHPAWTRKV